MHARRRDEVNEVFQTPLLDLVFHAATAHRMHHNPHMVGLMSHCSHNVPDCWACQFSIYNACWGQHVARSQSLTQMAQLVEASAAVQPVTCGRTLP